MAFAQYMAWAEYNRKSFVCFNATSMEVFSKLAKSVVFQVDQFRFRRNLNVLAEMDKTVFVFFSIWHLFNS